METRLSILDSIKKAFTGPKAELAAETTTGSTELPASFYVDTIEADRVEKDRFFRTSPYSPIEDRANFAGLNYYPPDPAFRFELALQEAEEIEALTIQKALRQCGGNKTRAAKLLGVSRKTLYKRIADGHL